MKQAWAEMFLNCPTSELQPQARKIFRTDCHVSWKSKNSTWRSHVLKAVLQHAAGQITRQMEPTLTSAEGCISELLRLQPGPTSHFQNYLTDKKHFYGATFTVLVRGMKTWNLNSLNPQRINSWQRINGERKTSMFLQHCCSGSILDVKGIDALTETTNETYVHDPVQWSLSINAASCFLFPVSCVFVWKAEY